MVGVKLAVAVGVGVRAEHVILTRLGLFLMTDKAHWLAWTFSRCPALSVTDTVGALVLSSGSEGATVPFARAMHLTLTRLLVLVVTFNLQLLGSTLRVCPAFNVTVPIKVAPAGELTSHKAAPITTSTVAKRIYFISSS